MRIQDKIRTKNKGMTNLSLKFILYFKINLVCFIIFIMQKSKHARFSYAKQKLSYVQSTQEMSPRSFFSVTKKQKVNLNVKMKTEREIQQKSQQLYESMGNPQNQFIKKRIKHFSTSLANSLNKRFPTGVSQSLQNSCPRQQLSVSMFQPSRCLHELASEQQRTPFINAHILKQKHKLERLILRRKEQQRDFQSISSKIRLKIKPKKLKISIDGPQKLKDAVWYRQWAQSVINSRKIRQSKICMRLKTTEAHRRNTYNFLDLSQN